MTKISGSRWEKNILLITFGTMLAHGAHATTNIAELLSTQEEEKIAADLSLKKLAAEHEAKNAEINGEDVKQQVADYARRLSKINLDTQVYMAAMVKKHYDQEAETKLTNIMKKVASLRTTLQGLQDTHDIIRKALADQGLQGENTATHQQLAELEKEVKTLEQDTAFLQNRLDHVSPTEYSLHAQTLFDHVKKKEMDALKRKIKSSTLVELKEAEQLIHEKSADSEFFYEAWRQSEKVEGIAQWAPEIGGVSVGVLAVLISTFVKGN